MVVKCGQSPKRSGFTLIELLVVIAIIAILIALLVPAVQKVREASARSTCQNNLKQIGLALHSYHGSFKVFPPGSVGNGGTAAAPVPAWGWSTMILPFLDQGPLYAQLDPDKKTLQQAFTSQLPTLQLPLAVYICPSDPGGTLGPSFNDNRKFTKAATGSVAIAKSNYPGNGGSLGLTTNEGVFAADSKVKIARITDGTSNTFMVGERDSLGNRYAGLWVGQSQEAPIVAMQALIGFTCFRMFDGTVNTPTVIAAEPAQAWGSQHSGGANFVLCDGTVRFISRQINDATYNNLGQIADGNPVGDY